MRDSKRTDAKRPRIKGPSLLLVAVPSSFTRIRLSKAQTGNIKVGIAPSLTSVQDRWWQPCGDHRGILGALDEVEFHIAQYKSRFGNRLVVPCLVDDPFNAGQHVALAKILTFTKVDRRQSAINLRTHGDRVRCLDGANPLAIDRGCSFSHDFDGHGNRATAGVGRDGSTDRSLGGMLPGARLRAGASCRLQERRAEFAPI